MSVSAESRTGDRASTSAARTPLIGWPEAAVALAAIVTALIPVIAIASRSAGEPALTWTGAIGGNVTEDAQQYLAWVVESSRHLLIGNLFTLADPERVFLHPAIAVSGAIHRLGIPVGFALAIWVPISLVVLIAGALITARAFLDSSRQRAAALAIALFYGFPPLLNRALTEAGSAGSRGLSATSIDSSALVNEWGYPLSVLAFALIPFGLLAYCRQREAGRALSVAASLCLLASAWLQPWQGLVALASLAMIEVSLRVGNGSGQRRAGASLFLTTAGATALPIGYYALLSVADRSFAATGPNTAWVASTETWWTILLAVVPLLAFASLAARPPTPAKPADVALRAWPVACVTVALAMSIGGVDAQASHALRGVSIPLAVLSVLGWLRLGLREGAARAAGFTAAACFALVFGLLPTVERATAQVRAIAKDPPSKGSFIGPEDLAALQWLRSTPGQGGVIAAGGLGPLVPATAGRQVWNGHWNWSPNATARRAATAAIVEGGAGRRDLLLGLPPGRFVAATGARFALLGCGAATPAAIAGLRPSAVSMQRFGCSAVIELKPADPVERERVTAEYGH